MKTHHNLSWRARRRSVLLAAAAWPLGAAAFDIGTLTTLRGSGHVTRTERALAAFHAIELSGAVRLVLEQGQPATLSVETDDNLQSHVKVEQHDGTLRLQWQGNLSPTRMHIVARVWNLQALDVSGGALLTAPLLVAKSLQIKAGGGAVMRLESLTAEDVDVQAGGGAVVKLAGQANALNVAAGGAGLVDAQGLQVRRAAVSVGGSGVAKVWAVDALSGSVSGAGALRYRGDPKLSVVRSGVGQLARLK